MNLNLKEDKTKNKLLFHKQINLLNPIIFYKKVLRKVNLVKKNNKHDKQKEF